MTRERAGNWQGAGYFPEWLACASIAEIRRALAGRGDPLTSDEQLLARLEIARRRQARARRRMLRARGLPPMRQRFP